jgi:hypothetical protein
MCWLIGPHILKPAYDNYQKGLAKDECESDLSCYESAASKDFGCDVWQEHETWTVEECGHQVCEAMQIEMKCSKDECSSCKATKEYEATKTEQEKEATKEQSDVSIMKDCMARVESKSARQVLETWLEDNSPNKKARSK